MQKKNYFSKRELKQILLLGYAFSCGGKNRFFFVNTNLFFTENVYSLEIFLFCGGKRGDAR